MKKKQYIFFKQMTKVRWLIVMTKVGNMIPDGHKYDV